MSARTYFYPSSIPEVDETACFCTVNVVGKHLMADNEALHELPGFERRRIEDGGVYDATLV